MCCPGCRLGRTKPGTTPRGRTGGHGPVLGSAVECPREASCPIPEGVGSRLGGQPGAPLQLQPRRHAGRLAAALLLLPLQRAASLFQLPPMLQ